MIAVAMPMTPKRARHGGALKLRRVPRFGEVSIAVFQPRTRAFRPYVATGTPFAINTLHLGVPELSACGDGAKRMQPTRPKRGELLPRSAGASGQSGKGGARNRADRESQSLTAAQIASLKAAERHSRAIGLPFTRMLTLHWQAAGVPLEGMVKATGRFVDLMARALARHGCPTAWVWTLENGDGKGWHCHLLAHVPAALVPIIVRLQRGWLRRITGGPYRASTIHSRPIGGRLGLEVGNPDLHAVNLEVAFAYLCKAAPQGILDAHGIAREHEPGGRIIGKRCATSQNIGARARKAKADQ